MSQELPLVSSPTNLLTIQDVVLDSPVWRANVLHLEDQIDQFEKWIDGFIRALKNYIDALIKHNNLATTLCKRTFFNGLDGTLIDSRITGNVVNKFATTLQSTIAYRMKMASDLEDLILNPLQQLIKYDLKSFKDSKKGFDKMLDKYETQLYRYNVLSKQKEASALREDAFQMYELRKLYVKNSGDYFTKLVTFKANLENILVECFSSALGAHIEEIDESVYACHSAKLKLAGWKQWLDESKVTCQYQINKMNKRCNELQDIYIEQVKPHRSLKRYSLPTTNDETTNAINNTNQSSNKKKLRNKQGYLNSRIIITGKSARPPWSRKWFFLQQGWFGTCTVTTINKEKGCITLGDRIPINETVSRISTGSDRRFCFEVIHPKCSYYLQAENEEEMNQWLNVIEYNMEKQQDQMIKSPSPQALLSPLMVNNNISSSSLVAMSTSPLPSPDSEGSLTPIISTTSSSLTALLIKEGENTTDDDIQQVTIQQDSNTISHQLYSWGMPWLSTGINALSNSSEEDLSNSPNLKSSNSNTISNINQLIVWPTKLEMDVPTPNLSHYSDNLISSNRELRKLFANVPKDEIVIESFSASLYQKPHDDTIDAHLSSCGYSGNVYVTQKSIWFYSCTLMTCVNMIVIPLSKVKCVRLETTKFSNNMLLMIEITPNISFYFGLWLEPLELVTERLKTIVENYNTMDIQTLYDTIRHITIKKTKTPTSHVTTSSALYASVTPLTVQAQQQPMQQTISSSTTSTNEDTDNISIHNNKEEDEVNPPNIHRGSPAQGALTAVYNASKKRKSCLKSSTQQQQQQQQTSTEEEDWPNHITKPKEKVECECTDHLDKIESDIILPIGAKKLFDFMYNTEIWKKLNQSKKYNEPTFTSWKENEQGQLERTMNYIMPVSSPMVKAKETEAIETQQIIYQKEYMCYVMMVMTKTPNLPYADAFIPCIKYCITYETPTSCRLVCSMGVKWIKSIFVKGMVNKAATKGMSETIQAILPVIQEEISKGQGKSITKETIRKSDALPILPPPKQGEKSSHRFTTIVTIFIGFLYILFMLHQVYLSKKCVRLLNQSEQEGNNMIWRGVYLRDIQDKVTEKEAVLNHVNPNVYKLFQEARTNGTTQQWKYVWFDKLHRNMAEELGYSRERLGAIRYELLSTFRILNRVEYQLLEIEYWNWLSDQKLFCSSKNQSLQICEIVNKERDA